MISLAAMRIWLCIRRRRGVLLISCRSLVLGPTAASRTSRPPFLENVKEPSPRKLQFLSPQLRLRLFNQEAAALPQRLVVCIKTCLLPLFARRLKNSGKSTRRMSGAITALSTDFWRIRSSRRSFWGWERPGTGHSGLKSSWRG